MQNSGYWINKLGLLPHPEGGWYLEIYRSQEIITNDALRMGFEGVRRVCTSIYYLLETGQVSRFHRIKSDEIWHHYEGAAINIHIIDPDGVYSLVKLGKNGDEGQVPQAVVPAGSWFGAALDETGYTLAGCTVAPGFDFKDFQLADKGFLLKLSPGNTEIIEKLA